MKMKKDLFCSITVPFLNKISKKKFLLVFFINIFFVFLFFLLIEIFTYKSLFVSDLFEFPDYKKFQKIKNEFIVDNHPFINYQQPKSTDPIYFENDGRSFIGDKYNSSSILLLGDSYTYGLGLKKDETFGFQLSNYLKKPVYTWGWCTEGIEYSLFLLKNKKNIDIIKKNKKNVDFVIYTYTYNQPGRFILPNRQYRYFWLRKFGLLSPQKYSVFDRLFSVLVIKNKLFLKSLNISEKEDKLHSFLIKEIIAVKNEVYKNFPDSKFVFLIYSDSADVIKGKNLFISKREEEILNSSRWKELEKEGIIVISTEELVGRKMSKDEIIDDEKTITIHPNSKAWGIIVPKLCKKLYGF